jgi:hypothetical protein
MERKRLRFAQDDRFDVGSLGSLGMTGKAKIEPPKEIPA